MPKGFDLLPVGLWSFNKNHHDQTKNKTKNLDLHLFPALPADLKTGGPPLTLFFKTLEKQPCNIEEGILETKTDCFAKDQLFFPCVAFCVITFEPIMI